METYAIGADDHEQSFVNPDVPGESLLVRPGLGRTVQRLADR